MGALDFLLKAYELKELDRKGWVKKVGIKNPESVASHTYGMLLLALLFYKDSSIMKEIVIHDLAEVLIGDLTPEEKSNESKDREKEAFKHLVSTLDKAKQDELISLYEQANFDMFVKELDKLDLAIQALYYKEKGYPKEKLEEFILTADTSIKNQKLRKIFEEVKVRFYS
ncbi:MAG TPA: HD domain-containing protein [Geobacterales bacterium]|nr:HD domain-containing protein [Geobacterales bacterium]